MTLTLNQGLEKIRWYPVGQKSYAPLAIFKLILLSQWHGLLDLEHALERLFELTIADFRLAVQRFMSSSIRMFLCVSFDVNTLAVFHWVNTGLALLLDYYSKLAKPGMFRLR
jgi:hypothetical protein